MYLVSKAEGRGIVKILPDFAWLLYGLTEDTIQEKLKKSQAEQALNQASPVVISQQICPNHTTHIFRGCLIIIWTGLNIKIDIVQKVYE